MYTSIQTLSLADPDRVTGLVVCGLLSLPCLDNIGRPKHTEPSCDVDHWRGSLNVLNSPSPFPETI